jgi:hypothetical protein
LTGVTIPAIVLAAQVIPDDTGQATLAQVQTAQVQTAQANATNAETTAAANNATNLTNIQNLHDGMAAQTTQADADIATLAGSADSLAPILTRTIQAAQNLRKCVSDLLTALNVK